VKRRGVWLVLSLISLAVVVSAAGLLAIGLLSRPVVSVPSSSALSLRVAAPYSEIDPSDLVQQLLETPPTLRSTIDLVRRAKADARIKVLIVRPSGAGALWAQVQELRAAIEDFKASGKPVIAYLEAPTTAEYYVATAATRIVMMPAGQLDLSGVAFYEMFFRGALDKMGIVPDLLHIGDYKSASNTFTEKGFTPAHREMTQSINRDWYTDVVTAIASGRKVSEDEAKKLVDGGPYLAQEALDAKLVDALAYDDQLDDSAPVQGTQPITSALYGRVPAPGTPAGAGRVALLYAVGTIASGKSSFDSPTGAVLGSDTFVEWIRKVRVDPEIAAVVVRVDSPGGSAIASEVIWRELMLTRDVKPLVVSMGDVAASGGYYIAAPAHAIFAQPGTLTGSIGVVTGKFVVAGGLEKLGISTATVSDGKAADIYSPFRPFSNDERSRLEAQMRAVYDLFVKRVAEGRQQTSAAIDAVAQGRVWTGRRARELGLVDELGGLDDAIRAAATRARLDLSRGVALTVYPAKRSIYELLAERLNGGSDLSAVLGTADARAVQTTVSMLKLFRRGEPLARLPNVFLN
jgi:protease-4